MKLRGFVLTMILVLFLVLLDYTSSISQNRFYSTQELFNRVLRESNSDFFLRTEPKQFTSYNVITVDLSTAHTLEPINISGESFSILEGGGVSWQFRFNDINNDAIPAYEGFSLNLKFTKIYYSNVLTNSTSAKILILR